MTGQGQSRVEGLLESSAGCSVRVEQVCDLFRSLGLTRRIGAEKNDEVWVASRWWWGEGGYMFIKKCKCICNWPT